MISLAHVRYVLGESEIKLRFRLLGKNRCLCRSIDEPLQKVCSRIQRLKQPNPWKTQSKKELKRLQLSSPPSPTIVKFLDEKSNIVDPKLPFHQAVQRAVEFWVDNDQFKVMLNQPRVFDLKIHHPCLVGVPIFPLATTEFCTLDECDFKWYRGEQLIGTSRKYRPIQRDVGLQLKFVCRPPREEAESVEIMSPEVVEGPVRDIFSPRVKWSETKDPEAFRVVSYNVLFDRYARMFTHCDPKCIDEMYRMQLVVQELVEYDADVICTQEIGERVYLEYFEPILKSLGFSGSFAAKTGSTPEGCSIFVRDSEFKVCETVELSLAKRYMDPMNAELRNLVSFNVEIGKAITALPTITQIQVIQHKKTGQLMILANTHAYFRNDADFVRLVQICLIAREVQCFVDKYPTAAVLLCGDFNAVPDSSAMNYLLQGSITSDHRHWKEAKSFEFRAAPVAADKTLNLPESIAHPFNFASGCEIPDFTTYTPEFIDTLDYILYDQDKLQCLKSIPMFQRHQVSPGLPNAVFPSDHIAIACDLKVKNYHLDVVI